MNDLQRWVCSWNVLPLCLACFVFGHRAHALDGEHVVGDWTVAMELAGAAQLGRLEIRESGGDLRAKLSSDFGAAQIQHIRIDDETLRMSYQLTAGVWSETVSVSLQQTDHVLSGTVSTGKNESLMEWPIQAARVGSQAEATLTAESRAKQNGVSEHTPELSVKDAKDLLGVWELTVKSPAAEDAPRGRMGLLVMGVDGRVVVGVKAFDGVQRTIYEVSKIENGLSWTYDINFGDTTIPFDMAIVRSDDGLRVTITSRDEPPFLAGTGIRKESADELGLDPSRVSQAPSVELVGMMHRRVVEVKDNLVFLQSGAKLTVLSVTNPLLVQFELARLPERCRVVAVNGTRASVGNWDSRQFELYDISDSTATALIGSCDLPGESPSPFAASDSLVFAVDRNGVGPTQQLHILDVSNSSGPILLGACDKPKGKSIYDIAAAGQHVYIAATGILQIIDVSDPRAPVPVGAFEGRGGWVRGVDVVGSIAYIATSMHSDASWLQMVDISDPSAPVQLGICTTDGGAQDVAVSGAIAFVADRSNGLLVLDVSDPVEPKRCGFFRTAGRAHAVTVAGDLVLVRVEGPMPKQSALAMLRYKHE